MPNVDPEPAPSPLSCCVVCNRVSWIIVALEARNFRILVFWGVTLRSWVDISRRFEGTYRLHPHLSSYGWRLTLKSMAMLIPDTMRSTLKMIASLGPQRWEHIFVWGSHEHCIAAEDIGSRKTIPIPRIQLCLYHSLRTFYKKISDQNLVWCDNQYGSRADAGTCCSVCTIASFPPWPALWALSWCTSFENVAVVVSSRRRYRI